jgi:hypothetical protein
MPIPSRPSHPIADRPLLDLAALIARMFVVGMSIAAVVAVPVLLVIALL